MHQTKHIGIIGAGLVGSLLSVYLSKRGYRVSVFERRNDLRVRNRDQGRSINLALSTRGIRSLEQVGLEEAVKELAIPMHGRMMHDKQGNLSFLPYGKKGSIHQFHLEKRAEPNAYGPGRKTRSDLFLRAALCSS